MCEYDESIEVVGLLWCFFGPSGKAKKEQATIVGGVTAFDVKTPHTPHNRITHLPLPASPTPPVEVLNFTSTYDMHTHMTTHTQEHSKERFRTGALLV